MINFTIEKIHDDETYTIKNVPFGRTFINPLIKNAVYLAQNDVVVSFQNNGIVGTADIKNFAHGNLLLVDCKIEFKWYSQ